MDSRVALLGSSLGFLGTAFLFATIPTNNNLLRLTAVVIGCSISVGLGVVAVTRRRTEISRSGATYVGWASSGLAKSTLRVSLIVWFVAFAASAVISVGLEESFQDTLALACLVEGIAALVGGISTLSFLTPATASPRFVPHVMAFPLAAAQLLAVWLLLS